VPAYTFFRSQTDRIWEIYGALQLEEILLHRIDCRGGAHQHDILDFLRGQRHTLKKLALSRVGFWDWPSALAALGNANTRLSALEHFSVDNCVEHPTGKRARFQLRGPVKGCIVATPSETKTLPRRPEAIELFHDHLSYSGPDPVGFLWETVGHVEIYSDRIWEEALVVLD
jgi:hypothetical protein